VGWVLCGGGVVGAADPVARPSHADDDERVQARK